MQEIDVPTGGVSELPDSTDLMKIAGIIKDESSKKKHNDHNECDVNVSGGDSTARIEAEGAQKEEGKL